MTEPESSIQVICLESPAFTALMDRLIEQMEDKLAGQQDQWISDAEAMQLLRITSRTTLQKYRDEGQLRFSQPSRKVILYDRDSILAFIEKHAKDPFQ